jgi:hypothetical protein
MMLERPGLDRAEYERLVADSKIDCGPRGAALSRRHVPASRRG